MPEASKAQGYLTNCNSQLPVSILTVLIEQDFQFTDKIRSSPLRAQGQQTHNGQACIQIPKLSDAAKSETASVMCLTEGSRHRRAEQARSRDGESWPQDLPGAEHPRPLSSPRRQEKGGSCGSPCSPHPATQLGDFACTILLSLRLVLPLSLPHHYFIFLGEARCCSQAASVPVRAIRSGCLLHLF